MAFLMDVQNVSGHKRRKVRRHNVVVNAPTTTTAAPDATTIGATKGLARTNLIDILIGGVPAFCNVKPKGINCPLVHRTSITTVFYYDSTIRMCMETNAACIQEDNTFLTIQECMYTCYRAPILADIFDFFTTTTTTIKTANTTVMSNATTTTA